MDPRFTPGYQANPYGTTGTPGFQNYDPFPYQDVEFEQKNFLLKEEEYNRYISVLNEKYRELEIKYNELLDVHGRTEADKENSKKTLNHDIRGLIMAVSEREKRVKEVEIDNKTLLIEIDKLTTVARGQEREILRLRLDNEDLKVKIASMENYTSIDVGELSRIIDDQKDEISDLRRKLNLSLENKRKLETELEALKFSMENMRSKYENELRDKVSQAIREVDNRVENRTKELTHQLDAYYKLEQDNIVLDRKNKELINEITLHINAQKLLKQELEYKDREMESSQRELAIYKATRPGNIPVASAEPKIYNHLVAMVDKRFEREKRGLYFAIWRLLYLYKNEAKFRNFDQQTIEALDEKTLEKVRFDFDDHGDISVATSLAEGVLKVLKYIREKLSTLVFELFLRSASQAEKKKQNSVILFSINLKELDDSQWRSLTLMLDTYMIIRKLLKIFHPKFLKLKKPEGTGMLETKLNLSLAKAALKGQNRNEVNRWIENSLVYILHKKRNDPDRNKEFMFLFRMLAIKYRIRSPMAGRELDIETDLVIYMDHKILAALQKLFRRHDKDRESIFQVGEGQPFDPMRETI